MAGMITSRECLAWASESPSACSSIASLRLVSALELVDRLDEFIQRAVWTLGTVPPVAFRLAIDSAISDW